MFKPIPLVVVLGLFLLSNSVFAENLTKAQVQSLSRLLTSEVTQRSAVVVVSAAELNDALKFESEKAALGCDNDGESCIAEIAAAMGTSHLLQTQLGKIGKTYLLSLQFFDDQATTLSRKTIQAETLDEIVLKMGPTLETMLEEAGLSRNAQKEGGDNVKSKSLLVLEIQMEAGAPAEKTEVVDVEQLNATSSSLSPFFMGGVGLLGGSALVASLAVGLSTLSIWEYFEMATPQPQVKGRQKFVPWLQGAAVLASGTAAVLGIAGGTLMALVGTEESNVE